MSIKRIAVEEAFVTQAIADEWDRVLAGRFVEPGFQKMGESILGDGPGARQLHARLLDIGAGRIAQMDADGIDLAILSITSPGVQVFDAVTASRLAQEANDVLAEAVRTHPQRLAGLAAVAPQFPDGAAAELERAVRALGMKGFLVNSHTMGQYLDDPKYWPLFEAAEALRTPMYLHPREPAPAMVQPFLDYGLYFAGLGFAVETSLHAMRLIMSGLFDRFPKLRVVLGHMGEGLPFWLKRLDNRYLLQVQIGAVAKLPRLPSEYFLDHFVVTTSGMTSAPVLKMCIEVLGSERILFAADYPYEDARESVRFLDAADIPSAQRDQIYRANAERVFGLA